MKTKISPQALILAEKLSRFFGECGIDYTASDIKNAAKDIDNLIINFKEKANLYKKAIMKHKKAQNNSPDLTRADQELYEVLDE